MTGGGREGYTDAMTRAVLLDVDGRHLVPAELATGRGDRARGLLGTRPGPVLVLPGTRSVHTFAMGYPLDVALCDGAGEVRTTLVLAPNRVCRPRRGVRTVIEAPPGSFERWALHPGMTLRLATSADGDRSQQT